LLQLGRGAVVRLGAANPPPNVGDDWRQVSAGEVSGWVRANAVEPVHLQAGVDPKADGDIARADQGGRRLGLGPDAQGVPPGPVRQLTPAGELSQDPTKSASAKQYRVLLPRLALRVAPDINAAIVTHLAGGQNVKALEQPPRRQWIGIDADGVRGWVPSQWLEPATAQD
jgi:pilus assembly protein CpaC